MSNLLLFALPALMAASACITVLLADIVTAKIQAPHSADGSRADIKALHSA